MVCVTVDGMLKLNGELRVRLSQILGQGKLKKMKRGGGGLGRGRERQSECEQVEEKSGSTNYDNGMEV